MAEASLLDARSTVYPPARGRVQTVKSEHLPGGSGGVWRVNDDEGVTRVHRPTGPWTPAVHALLAHLRKGGLDGFPVVHGLDGEGREVLDYLPGETLNPEIDQVSGEALVAAAAWLRRFHDAVRDFRPSGATWRQGSRSLRADEIICHNDPGLYNWVMVNGAFAGMIDWDRAGPGKPLDDLAFLCWSGVPLLREIEPAVAARRLGLAASAYGGVTPEQLLDAVDGRMALIAERWEVGLAAGDPGTVALKESGIMAKHLDRVEQFVRRKGAIRAAFLPNGAKDAS